MTPEQLPKTDEEWKIFLKLIAWLSFFGVGSWGAIKTIWGITTWFQEVRQMREQIRFLNKQNYLRTEDFAEFKINHNERENEINKSSIELIERIAVLETKIDMLLQERGLIDGDNYKGNRRRKTDLSKRFQISEQHT